MTTRSPEATTPRMNGGLNTTAKPNYTQSEMPGQPIPSYPPANTQTDPCAYHRCINGGMCKAGYNSTTGRNYTCWCSPSYYGKDCEMVMNGNQNQTASSPNGTAPGYNGTTNGTIWNEPRNQTNGSTTDPCYGNPCNRVNFGECSPKPTLDRPYTCLCPESFYGPDCEYNTCTYQSCMNGGSCRPIINSNGQYYCTCPAGYSGSKCETVVA